MQGYVHGHENIFAPQLMWLLLLLLLLSQCAVHTQRNDNLGTTHNEQSSALAKAKSVGRIGTTNKMLASMWLEYILPVVVVWRYAIIYQNKEAKSLLLPNRQTRSMLLLPLPGPLFIPLRIRFGFSMRMSCAADIFLHLILFNVCCTPSSSCVVVDSGAGVKGAYDAWKPTTNDVKNAGAWMPSKTTHKMHAFCVIFKRFGDNENE